MNFSDLAYIVASVIVMAALWVSILYMMDKDWNRKQRRQRTVFFKTLFGVNVGNTYKKN